MTLEKLSVSDTVSVTSDGRTIVDIPKLFAKPHIQRMLKEMRDKTRYVSIDRPVTKPPDAR